MLSILPEFSNPADCYMGRIVGKGWHYKKSSLPDESELFSQKITEEDQSVTRR
jgi:hypothetical protein